MEDSRMTLLGVLLIAATVGHLSGCGVLDVRADTDAAVATWALRTGETDPCRIDAMQHCVGASATTASLGPHLALLLGQLLELQQGDGDPMDLHNNQAGANCAFPIMGAVACCEDMLNADPSLLLTNGLCD